MVESDLTEIGVTGLNSSLYSGVLMVCSWSADDTYIPPIEAELWDDLHYRHEAEYFP